MPLARATRVGHDGTVNEQSLDRVNAFLAAAAERTEVGEVMDVTPAEMGRDLGFPDALSTARAVRALSARKRLEPAQGSYRLLDARPVQPGEKESVGRRPRTSRAPRQGTVQGRNARRREEPREALGERERPPRASGTPASPRPPVPPA